MGSLTLCLCVFLLPCGLLFFAAPSASAEADVSVVVPKGTAQVVCYDGSGAAITALEDRDRDGRFEIRTRFEGGRARRQECDPDGDGTPEEVSSWDEKGRLLAVETDTGNDGRMDTWRAYKEGVLARVEEDRNGDGKRDLEALYGPEGARRVISQDEDGDGHLETVQRFDQPPWTRVVTMDPSARGRPAVTLFYKGETLTERVGDPDQDGRPEWHEFYGPDGALKGRCEFLSEGRRLEGTCPVRFFYDQKGIEVLRAERDRDGDGRPEEWLFYEGGRLARAEEDGNGDGRVNVWEVYDAEARLALRDLDLDGDGRPDASD